MEESRVALNTPRAGLRMAGGLLVVAAIAVLFVVLAVRAPSTGKQIGAAVVAALFTAVFVGLAVSTRYVLAPRAFVVDADSVRYDSRRRPWSVRWRDLQAVYVESGRHRHLGAWWGPRRLRNDAFVRLVVQPLPTADGEGLHNLQRFRGRWGAGPDGYGVPLGPMPELAAPLDAALRAHGTSAYQPLHDLGEVPPGFL